MNYKQLALLILAICYLVQLWAIENKEDIESKQEIMALLRQWPENFNAGKIPEVCQLFANDLVASYPGIKDRNYEEMCRHLTLVLKHPEKKFRYNHPDIEEMIIQGDLAIVRLIWTLNMIDIKRSTSKVIREKGLDIFKRQKDGSWRIAISYAYPERVF